MVTTEVFDQKQIWLLRPAELHRLQNAFARLYITVYGGHPYYQSLTEAKALRDWQEYTKNGCVMFAFEGSQPIGFAAAVPLEFAPQDVQDKIVPIFGPSNKTVLQTVGYITELGVLEAYRGRGTGSLLVQGLIKQIAKRWGPRYCLRTLLHGSMSLGIFTRLGAKQAPPLEGVETTGADGTKRRDGYFWGVILT